MGEKQRLSGKLNRETKKKGWCHRVQERKVLKNWIVNNVLNSYREVRKNGSPTMNSVYCAKAQETVLSINHPQTKTYYFE